MPYCLSELSGGQSLKKIVWDKEWDMDKNINKQTNKQNPALKKIF